MSTSSPSAVGGWRICPVWHSFVPRISRRAAPGRIRRRDVHGGAGALHRRRACPCSGSPAGAHRRRWSSRRQRADRNRSRTCGQAVFRAIAAWRGQGDYRYRETYTPRELLAAVLAGPNLARAHHRVETESGPLRLLRTQRVRLENPRTGNRGEIHRRAAVVHAPRPVRCPVEQPGMVRLRPPLDHYFRPLITFHIPRTQRCTYSIGSRTMPCLPTP